MLEELRQLAFHLLRVVFIEVENLLARFAVQVRIVPDVVVETGQVLIPERLRQLQHLGFNLGYLLHAHRMNLLRRQVGGGLLAHREAIAFGPVRQRPHARIGPSLRCVFVLHKSGKLRIRRIHFVVDRPLNRESQPPAIRLAHIRWKFLQRLGKWTAGQWLGCDVRTLRCDLVQQIPRRHQVVGHPLAHVSRHLIEHPRDAVQTRHVILVILHRLQRHLRHQARNAQLDAVHLIHRHLPAFESGSLDGLAQLPQHQRLVENFLLREASGVDRLENPNLLARVLNLALLFSRGVVAPSVVVTRIADRRRQLRARPQRVLPFLLQSVAELRPACGETFRRLCDAADRENRNQKQRKQQRAAKIEHQA